MKRIQSKLLIGHWTLGGLGFIYGQTDCTKKEAGHTYVSVHLYTALGEPEPETRTDVVEVHRLDETVEGGGRVAAVQQLDAHVVKQHVMTIDTQRLQLSSRQLLTCVNTHLKHNIQ